jgi:hypothetical protein
MQVKNGVVLEKQSAPAVIFFFSALIATTRSFSCDVFVLVTDGNN